MTSEARKTRILLVIAGLPAGGAERQMVLLAKMLDRSVYEVGFLIFNAAGKIYFRDIFEIPLWFRALGLSRQGDGLLLVPRLIAGLHRAVADFKPDAVHASLNVANQATRLTALLRRWNVPIVTSVRVDFRAGYRPYEKKLERLLWRRSDHIICNAETTRMQLIEDLAVPPNRVSTILNGIDEKFFIQSDRPKPSWWPGGQVALIVGRFKPQKNHLGLLAAIEYLAKTNSLYNWNFVFLGEGPLDSQIRGAIKSAGLQDRIIVVPPQSDLSTLYRTANLFILPSLFEGLSNALLEAVACGCPVAVTPGANNAGIIVPDRGWLLSDPLELSLEKALQATDFDRAAAAARASSYFAAIYTAREMAAKTAEIYESVTRGLTPNATGVTRQWPTALI